MNNTKELSKLSIGFIGAGRVGFTLARYFYEKNLRISGFFSRSYESAREAAEFTKSKACSQIAELAAESDIIFITTPDSSIYDVYLQLKECGLKDKILCHASGAMPSQVFDGIEREGACGYSVHPIFAVSDKKNSYREIGKAYFTVEGSSEKMYVIEELFARLGNGYQVIGAENKAKYHASLVMSSNLVIGLYHMAASLLCECGFSEEAAQDALKPLFLNNAENLCRMGCEAALTGPVDRNDCGTVKKHLAVMAEAKRQSAENDDGGAGADGADTAITAVYKLLSQELIKVAEKKYPKRDYGELAELLKDAGSTAGAENVKTQKTER